MFMEAFAYLCLLLDIIYTGFPDRMTLTILFGSSSSPEHCMVVQSFSVLWLFLIPVCLPLTSPNAQLPVVHFHRGCVNMFPCYVHAEQSDTVEIGNLVVWRWQTIVSSARVRQGVTPPPRGGNSQLHHHSSLQLDILLSTGRLEIPTSSSFSIKCD